MAFIQNYVSRDGFFFFSQKKNAEKKKNLSRDGKGFCVHATSAKSCIPFFFSFLNQTYPLVLMLLAKV